jgi:amidase
MVSVGTETSGSLIAPGACNGVVAMKPGLGVVSGEGIVPLIRFQDSAGPVARRVADAALLLGVMDEKDTDYTAALKPDALAGVPAGVLRGSLTGHENTEWLRRIDEGLRKAKAAPCDVPDTFKGKPSILPLIFLGLQLDTLGFIAATGSPVKTIADLKAYNAAKPDTRIPLGENLIDMGAAFMPALLEELKAHPGTQAKAYQELALDLRRQMSARLDEAFRTAKVEVLVSLANAHSDLYATAGYPAITVPLGLDLDGTPNGVTFIGKPGQDATLLGYAFAYEQATHYRVNPPADGL